MPRPTSKATDPWAALDAIVKREQEPMGPEWFTAEQFAERYQRSYSGAQSKCYRMVKSGLLKQWKGICPTSKRIIVKYCLA